MQTHASRRTFVRQMTLGLPVMAGTIGLTQTVVGAGAPQHGMPMPLPQVDLILRDLARIHNQLRRRPATADDLRAIGSQVRTLAAYQLQAQRDVVITRALRDGLDAAGRTAVLEHEPDMEVMRRELMSFGFDLPASTPAAGRWPDSTRADRATTFDRLKDGGLAPLYANTALAIDSPEMQDLLQAAGSNCEILQTLVTQMEVVAAVMCSLAAALPLLAPDCFAAAAVLAALKLIVYLGGC